MTQATAPTQDPTPIPGASRLQQLDGLRGFALLGILLAAGRRVAQGGLLADTRLLRRVLLFGLLVGLPASLVYAFLPDAGQTHWSSMVGTVPLALAYAAAFLLAWPHAQRVLGVFVAPGRMPLTNYLLQSVVNGWCSSARGWA